MDLMSESSVHTKKNKKKKKIFNEKDWARKLPRMELKSLPGEYSNIYI